MELGMSLCPSEDEDDTVPTEYLQALNDTTNWKNIEHTASIPPLSLKNIHHYFIGKRITKDQVTATKPFEKGYRIYDAKRVKAVSIHNLSPDSLFCVIRATVVPSQRTDRLYTTHIVVHKSTADITYATCTCTAGKGQSCNHIAALTFFVEAHFRIFSTQCTSTSPSCTSLPAKWNVPSK